MISLSWMI